MTCPQFAKALYGEKTQFKVKEINNKPVKTKVVCYSDKSIALVTLENSLSK
jgi:hypothetical protein